MKLSTRPAEFLGDDRAVGPRRGRAEAGARRRRRAVHDQRGRRGVLRPEDRLRRDRRHRPEMAVRHDSARLPDSAAVRPEVHRRRQRRAPAGGHPSRDFRQLRAVHRAAHRALRRRVAALAGAGAGGRPADRRPAPATTPRACGTGWPRPGCGSNSTGAQEKIGYKIREAQLQKVPYMLVIGDREAAEGTVAVRSRSAGDSGPRRVDDVHRGRARGDRRRRSPAAPVSANGSRSRKASAP